MGEMERMGMRIVGDLGLQQEGQPLNGGRCNSLGGEADSPNLGGLCNGAELHRLSISIELAVTMPRHPGTKGPSARVNSVI